MGEGALGLRVSSSLLLSLSFLPSGDQTYVSRGLGHFVCILTVILRFAAKRQCIKVLPLKREGVTINDQLKDVLGSGLSSIHYHYLRLIEINCFSTSALPSTVLPLGRLYFSPVWVNK